MNISNLQASVAGKSRAPSQPTFGPEPQSSSLDKFSPQHLGLKGTRRELRPGLIVDDRVLTLPEPQNTSIVNGSIARINKDFFAAYRVDPLDDHNYHFGQQLAMVSLDEQLQAVGKPQILDTRDRVDIRPTAEDPRLFEYRNNLFVAYNSTATGEIHHTQRDMYLLELILQKTDQNFEYVIKRRKQLFMVNGRRNITEKNWTPFVYQDKIHFIYQSNPPYVGLLEPKEWERPGSTVQLQEAAQQTDKIAEPFGTMRGGTPALLYEKTSYLSFFHTFLIVGRIKLDDPYTAIYTAGAYLFESEPPFAIKKVLTVPLVPPSAYEDSNLEVDGGKKLGWVTYPQGLFFDHKYAYVSYAQNDRRLRLMTINLQVLQSMMRPPSPADAISR